MDPELQPGQATAAPAAPRAPAPAPGFEAPEQEAAFFFGLYLRGFSYQELRQDIEVPLEVQRQWERAGARDASFLAVTHQVLGYRRRVLAIFQALVANEDRSSIQ
ncbi:MAG: hypothetical protein ACRD1E_13650 [Terriglobales bacterium]